MLTEKKTRKKQNKEGGENEKKTRQPTHSFKILISCKWLFKYRFSIMSFSEK